MPRSSKAKRSQALQTKAEASKGKQIIVAIIIIDKGKQSKATQSKAAQKQSKAN